MPVLPLVGSTTTPPGLSCPLRSASSIIARQMRSFTEPPGFACSIFAQTLARGPARPGAAIATSGVSPTRSSTSSARRGGVAIAMSFLTDKRL